MGSHPNLLSYKWDIFDGRKTVPTDGEWPPPEEIWRFVSKGRFQFHPQIWGDGTMDFDIPGLLKISD